MFRYLHVSDAYASSARYYILLLHSNLWPRIPRALKAWRSVTDASGPRAYKMELGSRGIAPRNMHSTIAVLCVDAIGDKETNNKPKRSRVNPFTCLGQIPSYPIVLVNDEEHAGKTEPKRAWLASVVRR